MLFNFWKNKKLLFGIVCLIIILMAVIVAETEPKRKSPIPIYPLRTSGWEKFLANVSQFFKIGLAKKIEVDLSQQKMKIFEGKKKVGEFLVSTGSKKNPTPTGKFKVYNKKIMIYSKTSKCWLPFWVGFTSGGYGFHEVPICEEGRRGLKELGKSASLGCVRLGIKDSEFFYEWVEIGTPVVIYGKKAAKIGEEKPTWCYNFKINLKLGERNNEVRHLQIALNSDPETELSEIGPGSPGHETVYFGPLTKMAVIKFQEKYKDDILSPWYLTQGTGFVGPLTRNKLNQLFGCQ